MFVFLEKHIQMLVQLKLLAQLVGRLVQHQAHKVLAVLTVFS